MTEPLTISVHCDDEPLASVVAAGLEAASGFRLVQPFAPSQIALVDERLGGAHNVVGGLVRGGDTTCLALSDGTDPDRLLGLLAAGVRGCVPRDGDARMVTAAVQAAARGMAQMPAAALPLLAGRMSPRDASRASDRAAIENVMAQRRYETVFQPIVDLRNGRISGVEALTRFHHELGHPPNVWLELAAEAGLRVALEHDLLRAGIAAFATAPADVWLAVNLSPEAAVDRGLEDVLADAPVDRLVLEITDHRQVDDYEPLAEALADLRQRGLRIAVDDSGQGIASLQQVARLAPTFLKLNRLLTRNIDRDPTKHALAYALTAFAEQIGTRIVAEGLETEDELQSLRALGAPLGQGYLLARPRPLSDFDFGAPLNLPAGAAPDATRAETVAGLRLTPLAEEDFREACRLALRFVAAQRPEATFGVSHLDYAQRRHTILSARGPATLGLDPGSSMAVEDSLCFHMAAGRGPRVCSDVGDDVCYGALAFTRRHDVGSYVGVPLELAGGARVGALFGIARGPDAFSPADVALLEAVAALLTRVLAEQTDGLASGQVMRLLRDMAQSDELTGLLNPPSFRDAVTAELRRARSRHHGHYLAVQVDDLPSLLARYGRAVTDLLVKDVASVLEASVDVLDFVGRVGDDRFAALLVHTRDESSVTRVERALQSRLTEIARRRDIKMAIRFGATPLHEVDDADGAWDAAIRAPEPVG